MKKLLFLFTLICVLLSTSCDKLTSEISIEDYPKAIIGRWECIEYTPSDGSMEDGYRWLIEFTSNNIVKMYDNIDFVNDHVIYSESSLKMFQSNYYWIKDDRINDKNDPACSEYYCSEFGNPNCECNLDCDSHLDSTCHYTRIIKLTESDLVFEIVRSCDEERTMYTFKKSRH